jgi:hypothetical protein
MENKKREKFKRQLFYTLPSGSGIDGRWNIKETRNAIVCSNFWHCLNENGYYDGYIDFDIVFPHYASLYDFKIHAKNWRNNRYKIERYWKNLQVKEYIEDTIYQSIKQLITLIRGF